MTTNNDFSSTIQDDGDDCSTLSTDYLNAAEDFLDMDYLDAMDFDEINEFVPLSNTPQDEEDEASLKTSDMPCTSSANKTDTMDEEEDVVTSNNLYEPLDHKIDRPLPHSLPETFTGEDFSGCSKYPEVPMLVTLSQITPSSSESEMELSFEKLACLMRQSEAYRNEIYRRKEAIKNTTSTETPSCSFFSTNMSLMQSRIMLQAYTAQLHFH